MKTQNIVVLEKQELEEKPKTKSLENRIKAGKRQARILRNQHRLKPFTHEFVLRFNTEFDQKRFRRRISEQLSGSEFHIVWFFCISKGGTVHYHSIVRVEAEKIPRPRIVKKTLRIAILKALSKDVRHKLDSKSINLRFRKINPKKLEGLFLYTAKSTPKLLAKDQPQPVGSREAFKTGKPFSKPTEELAKLTPEEAQRARISWLMKHTRVMERILDGEVDPFHKRFLWMAYSGRNVSDCRPNGIAHNPTTYPSSTYSKATKSIKGPPRKVVFAPKPPDHVLGGAKRRTDDAEV